MAARAGFDMVELACGAWLSGVVLHLAFVEPADGRLRRVAGEPDALAARGVPGDAGGLARGKADVGRISANDWVGDDGVTPEEAVAIARAFSEAGADIIDVSAGQTSTEARPVYGRMFQTPFSDRIRNEAGIATMAVGNIYEADHVNSILMAGRADLVCLARPHLADPYWTLHAGAAIGDRQEAWPAPYRAGRDQSGGWRTARQERGGAGMRRVLVTGADRGSGGPWRGPSRRRGMR
jgi:anthraniloyl-CoA monooxygenase